MIKHIVFDYGNVLVRWDPPFILKDMGYAEADIELLLPAVFEPTRWEKNDTGAFTAAEYVKKVCPLLPERLHGAVADIMGDWYHHLPPIKGMPELIETLKAEKYGIYLLSNIAAEFAPHTECIPHAELFDGMVFSGIEKITKPDPEIFKRLLTRYGLAAADCLFVDDRQKNVDAAIFCGMQGYLFDEDAEKLKNFIFID